jgi:hypothetical protein
MNDLFVYSFFIFFIIIFSSACGGFNLRSRYAFKVSSTILEFVKNYFWSYTLSYKQIKNSYIFIPETNSKIEKLLALAIEGKINSEHTKDWWRSDAEIILVIDKSKELDNSSKTIEFKFQSSNINGEPFLLSPSVFFLAQKLHDILLAQEKQRDDKRRETII